MGGQQPAAFPCKHIFLKQTPRRGLPLAWNAGAGSFLSQVKKFVQQSNSIFAICNSTLLLLH